MTIDCTACLELLAARVDDELGPDDRHDVDLHLRSCGACSEEYEMQTRIHRQVGGASLRYPVPDLLEARIRQAIGTPQAVAPPRVRAPWIRLAAAGVVVAVLSSAATIASLRARAGDPIVNEVVASHVRSLQPGHLTDIVSTNQHNVKPWFNGRTDVSPAVPDLSSRGFELIGGRLDYVGGRSAAVVVYARRQHMINVYTWPDPDGESTAPRITTRNGYNLIEWRAAGLRHWVVSDLNLNELQDIARALE